MLLRKSLAAAKADGYRDAWDPKHDDNDQILGAAAKPTPTWAILQSFSSSVVLYILDLSFSSNIHTVTLLACMSSLHLSLVEGPARTVQGVGFSLYELFTPVLGAGFRMCGLECE